MHELPEQQNPVGLLGPALPRRRRRKEVMVGELVEVQVLVADAGGSLVVEVLGAELAAAVQDRITARGCFCACWVDESMARGPVVTKRHQCASVRAVLPFFDSLMHGPPADRLSSISVEKTLRRTSCKGCGNLPASTRDLLDRALSHRLHDWPCWRRCRRWCLR